MANQLYMLGLQHNSKKVMHTDLKIYSEYLWVFQEIETGEALLDIVILMVPRFSVMGIVHSDFVPPALGFCLKQYMKI